MTSNYSERLSNLKARQLAGERLPCPRCGRDTMDAKPLHNALSRHADVLLCGSCGMDEALVDMKQPQAPLGLGMLRRFKSIKVTAKAIP